MKNSDEDGAVYFCFRIQAANLKLFSIVKSTKEAQLHLMRKKMMMQNSQGSQRFYLAFQGISCRELARV